MIETDTRARRLARMPESLGSRLFLAGLLVTLAMLAGVLALSKVLTDDPRVIVGGVGLALVVSAATALTLRRLIRSPFDSMVRAIDRACSQAMADEPYSSIRIEGRMPREFRDMMEVVDRLAVRFSDRQSELREMARRSAEAAEHLLVAVDESTEGKILLIDEVVTLANPAAATHFGQPVKRMGGSVLEDALGNVSLLDTTGTTFEPAAALEASLNSPVTFLAITTDERRRWLELRTFRHRDRGIMMLTSRDVTDIKRREEVRQEMLALISHDIKSPITATGGFLDIIESRCDDQIVSKAIAGARGSVSRTLGLLADAMTVSDAQDIFAPRSLAAVDVSEIAEEAASIYRMTAGRTIEVETPGPVWTRGELRRIRQAVGNLIGNAVKYTQPEGLVRVLVNQADDTARVTVEDDGPGIPLEDRARVFERFERGTAQGTGSGLGLYIARSIVEAHGGYIRLEEPSAGTGARITMGLPASDPPEGRELAALPPGR